MKMLLDKTTHAGNVHFAHANNESLWWAQLSCMNQSLFQSSTCPKSNVTIILHECGDLQTSKTTKKNL